MQAAQQALQTALGNQGCGFLQAREPCARKWLLQDRPRARSQGFPLLSRRTPPSDSARRPESRQPKPARSYYPFSVPDLLGSGDCRSPRPSKIMPPQAPRAGRARRGPSNDCTHSRGETVLASKAATGQIEGSCHVRVRRASSPVFPVRPRPRRAHRVADDSSGRSMPELRHPDPGRYKSSHCSYSEFERPR